MYDWPSTPLPQQSICDKNCDHWACNLKLSAIKHPTVKFTTQKYSTKRSCPFNYNSPLQFRKWNTKRYTMNWFYIMYAYRSTVWKSVFLLHPDCTYYQERKYYQCLVLGTFWKWILSQKNQRVLVLWIPYGHSLRYHSFKQKQGLFHRFNPHSTMARSHITRNRHFLESISFSF